MGTPMDEMLERSKYLCETETIIATGNKAGLLRALPMVEVKTIVLYKGLTIVPRFSLRSDKEHRYWVTDAAGSSRGVAGSIEEVVEEIEKLSTSQPFNKPFPVMTLRPAGV